LLCVRIRCVKAVIAKMRTERKKGRLIIRDQPLVFWMFYSCFVVGGIAALLLVLATTPDTTTALIVSIIGIGNIAGGVYMLRREPASILIFDLASDKLLVRRWHLTGKKDTFYPLSSVSSVEVAMKEHTEGGHVYRPSLCLNESVAIPVSMFWYQTMQKSEVAIKEIRSFLNLSPNKLPVCSGLIPINFGVMETVNKR
jgi:hypothetical protein